jgi:hypothetical protein
MAKLTIKEVERRVMEAMGESNPTTNTPQIPQWQQLLSRAQQLKQGK